MLKYSYLLLKVQIKKNLFTITHLNIIKQEEIRFVDTISEVDKFLKNCSNRLKSDNRQEGKSENHQSLFLEGNDHLTILNEIFTKLKKYAKLPEFISLINPIQMKLNHYIENINTISDKFIISLQKGTEENDQSCLEYVAEGERLINDSYYLINNSFNEKIMKAIDRSYVENESIFKDSKRILGLLSNLKSILENICKEEYICSLNLKKKVENKLLSIKNLIINLEGLLLAISNCSFFNISNINSIMHNNMKINEEKTNENKKIEKLKRILNHIKEIEGFLKTNQMYLFEKSSKNIMERFNIEVKFYNFFLFMDEINVKVLKTLEFFKLNEFSILLFDEGFLEQINELCELFNKIDAFSKEILSLNYDQITVLNKISNNIKEWKENIQNLLYFDDKSIVMLKSKLNVIFNLKKEEDSILREINGMFALAEKTPPRKKKKNSVERESLFEKFFNEANAFAELNTEALVAKDFVFGYRQKVIFKNKNWGGGHVNFLKKKLGGGCIGGGGGCIFFFNYLIFYIKTFNILSVLIKLNISDN